METKATSKPSFDLNSASVEELVDNFPELGFFSAEDIVAWREKNGPFTTIEPLVDELGLSEAVAVSLLRVTRTETMAPGSGEFETSSIAPGAADAGASEPAVAGEGLATAPATPPADDDDVVFFGPPKTAEPAKAAEQPPPAPPAPTKTTPAPKAASPADEPERAEEPARLGSEARIAVRLGLGADDPRALERTGVNRAAFEPEVAQAAEPAPSPSEPPVEPEGKRSASFVAERRAKRSFVVPIVVTLALVANAGLGFFLFQVRKETQGVKAPVAALSGEMNGLREEQAQAKEELVEQKTKLEKQAKSLQKTIDRVDATEARQKEAERQAREAAKAEAKEVAALTARLGRVESRSEKASFRLDEALKIIDSVQGKPAPAEDEPPRKTRSKLDDVADTRR